MLIFTRRRQIPWEVAVLEAIFIVGAVSVLFASGLAVTRFWQADLWSGAWVLNAVMIVFAPIMAAWIYFGGVDRDRFVPSLILGSWAVGVSLAIVVHYAAMAFYAWQDAHPYLFS
ncbi:MULTISPECIES: hypothetical protein [Caballeronia]|uniref:hypothetical protein n=1 Tax=Caballeronia TaxID=1827195 RepID=UPI001FD178B6|nr:MULTISPECIES: hypothetical protein [Caballeronia]MDR5798994.1 hypothetical protein [Caballeronia sp. LZ001]